VLHHDKEKENTSSLLLVLLLAFFFTLNISETALSTGLSMSTDFISSKALSFLAFAPVP
jgi:hypothetical protein